MQSPRTTLAQYPTEESTIKGTHYNLGVVAAQTKLDFTATAESSFVGKGKVGEEHSQLIHKSMLVQEFPGVLEKIF